MALTEEMQEELTVLEDKFHAVEKERASKQACFSVQDSYTDWSMLSQDQS